ncbi:hypothetical protein PC122_g23023 [Phytophthora cactorum]|nr:hypothetical protein PC122_g23023 [Phytophthora cactorum]
MRKYRLVAKKGEGTFSEVLKAQNVKDNKFHAIKCMKNHFESIDQRKGNDNSDDKTPLPSIQNGSHGPQATTDTKDYGAYDASEDELPPINHAAGGRGMGSITKVKTRKYSFSSKNGNNNKTSESSLGGGSIYSGGLSKAAKGGLANGGSTNRSTYHQDIKTRKNVANVALKKGISSARTKKIVSAAYADASAVYADASGPKSRHK